MLLHRNTQKTTFQTFNENKVNMKHTAFIKIIKITENRKVIAYFTEQQMMEMVVGTLLKEGSADLIWKVQNFKMIYINGRASKKIEREKTKRLIRKHQLANR